MARMTCWFRWGPRRWVKAKGSPGTTLPPPVVCKAASGSWRRIRISPCRGRPASGAGRHDGDVSVGVLLLGGLDSPCGYLGSVFCGSVKPPGKVVSVRVHDQQRSAVHTAKLPLGDFLLVETTCHRGVACVFTRDVAVG